MGKFTYGNELEYVYNLSGALTEEKYPSGRVVKNVLDNDGELSMVQSKKTSSAGFLNYAKHFTYTAAGAVSSMQLGNSKWESTQFNSRLQPTQIALGSTPNATDNLKLNFTYNTTGNADNNGNVLTQTIIVPTEVRNSTTYNGFTATQNYTYDSLNRIHDASETIASTQQWKQTFSYDRFGNRTFDEANTTTLAKNCGSSPSFTVCTADRKVYNPTPNTSDNRLSSNDGYSFDLSGNTTRDAQSRKFTYDAENKQTKVETVDSSGNPINTIGEYSYDGDGKRVKKYVPSTGETTIFVYDASGKMVAEYSTNLSQTPQVSYLTSDHLGSPRINTDQNGAVTARHDYQPFGEEIQRTSYGADEVRKQFTGYEQDTESKLNFAQARYQDGVRGRFTSPDKPLIAQSSGDPQSWNLYIYAGNNPLLFTDPTGRWYWSDPDKNGKRFAVWEDGDTWETLADFLYDNGSPRIYNASQLNDFYSDATLGDGLIIDTQTLYQSLRGSPRDGGVEDVSLDFYMTVLPAARAAKGLGSLIWGGLKAGGRAVGGLFARKAATSVAEVAATELKGSSGYEMLKDAIRIVKEFSGTPQQKAELFENFTKKIAEKTGGSWSSSAGQTTIDGGTIFVGTQGQALVIDTAGQIFTAPLSSGGWKLTSKGYEIIYEVFKKW